MKTTLPKPMVRLHFTLTIRIFLSILLLALFVQFANAKTPKAKQDSKPVRTTIVNGLGYKLFLKVKRDDEIAAQVILAPEEGKELVLLPGEYEVLFRAMPLEEHSRIFKGPTLKLPGKVLSIKYRLTSE